MRFSRTTNRPATRNEMMVTRNAIAPVLEAMEARRLLSVALDDGTLSVSGTPRADSISIGLDSADPGRLKVSVNRTVSHFDLSAVAAINVEGRSGSDSVVVDLAAGSGLKVRVNGGNGNDRLRGSAGADTLLGGHGKDLLIGGDGDDLLQGGMQDDRILAGAGDDTIFGGHGHDVLNSGGDDGDVVDGGRGDNDIDSGRANGFSPANEGLLSGSRSASDAVPLARPADSGYSPQQMRKAYGFGDLSNPSFTNRGKGQTVAVIIAFDYPNARKDLTTFSQEFGLPVPTKETFGQVYASGVQPFYDPGWAGEAALDIQWIHAIAPEARIVLVHGDTNLPQDLDLAVERATEIVSRAGGGVISMSLGHREFAPDDLRDFVFTGKGSARVSYVAASGDAAQIRSHPATSPNVLSVGGTFIPLDADGDLTGPEEVWADGGGGASAVFKRPSYQYGVTINGKPVPGTARLGPDIAYNADPLSGVAVFHSDVFNPDGEWVTFPPFSIGVGGTSASAPQISGMIALANERRVAAGKSTLGRWIHQAIYEIARNDYADNFRDITVGEQANRAALPGFDLVTGWGVPRATELIASLAQVHIPTDPANLAFQARFVKPEGSVFGLSRFVFGGSGNYRRINPREVELNMGAGDEGIVTDVFIDQPLRKGKRGFTGMGRVTLATAKGLPVTFNVRVNAGFNKRGKLGGEFIAVSSRGKVLREGNQPVLRGTFGPPV